ncbi:hypothetical protein CW304_13480 [Bacillus sp. UFRGS-B20]|nr:hypothetical protein CW304_13480 [Bacillus sp. UFRGS-B20]
MLYKPMPIKWSTIGPNKVQRIFLVVGSGKPFPYLSSVIHAHSYNPNGLTLFCANLPAIRTNRS